MANVSKLQAVFGGRCPRCRQGKIFKVPMYSLFRFGEMNEHCDHCGLKFEVEPGYFYGAMFVSYAISAGVALVLGFVIFYLADDPGGWTYALVVAAAMIIIAPSNFRLSRSLWLHYVAGIRYDKDL